MSFSTPQDIVNAKPVKLPMPEAIFNEYLQNGHPAEKINDLSYEDGPAAVYADAHGYLFDFGHVIESQGEEMLEFEVCLDDLLEWCHRKGMALSDLSDAAISAMYEFDLPNYIDIDEGGVTGTFSVMVFEPDDYAHARQWMAKTFIPKLLPKLVESIKEQLADD